MHSSFACNGSHVIFVVNKCWVGPVLPGSGGGVCRIVLAFLLAPVACVELEVTFSSNLSCRQLLLASAQHPLLWPHRVAGG